MQIMILKDKGSDYQVYGGTLIVRQIDDTGDPISSGITAISKANPAVVTVENVALLLMEIQLSFSVQDDRS